MASIGVLFISVLVLASFPRALCLAVLQGGSVTLPCGNLSTNNRPDVTWCKKLPLDLCNDVCRTFGNTKNYVYPPWDNNGTQLTNYSSLTIASVNHTRDNGTFICVSGNTEAEVDLTVIVSHRIGKTANYVYPPWNNSDTQLTNYSSLTIAYVNHTRDNGTFICVSGSTDAEVDLTVIVPVENLTLDGNPKSRENSAITFTCRATGGTPKPLIEWTGPKSANMSTRQDHENQTSTVEFIVTRDMNASKIQCKAVQANVTVNTTSLTLDIKYKPEVSTNISRNVAELNMGDRLEMECRADGNPFPDIWWSFHGANRSGTRYTIPGLNDSNVGEYICTARNSEGEDRQAVSISVKTTKSNNNHMLWQFPVYVCSGILVLTSAVLAMLYYGWLRKRPSKRGDQATQQPRPVRQELRGHYATIWFDTPTAANSEIRRSVEPVVYATVDFKATAKRAKRKRGRRVRFSIQAAEDTATLNDNDD